MNDKALKTIRQIRMLSAETVENAKSGHPGMPMGAAAIAYALYHHIMKYDPEHPDWVDRDRFILSAGHASALLYTMLYLYGYEVSLEDLKNFRRLGSRTPGHPEFWCLPGVETTTGPLGAGFSNGVGMALGERRLRSILGENVINHYTYVLSSDGDMMEGIVYEAASFAGTQKLDRLVVFYDSNRISIEGNTDLALTENVAERFRAMNWYVTEVDGTDPDEVVEGWRRSMKEGQGMPKLIICHTTIAMDGGPKEGSEKSHGSPLGEDVLKEMRRKYGYPEDEWFHLDPDVRTHIEKRLVELKRQYQEWDAAFHEWRRSDHDRWTLYRRLVGKISGEIDYPTWEPGSMEATRKSSGKILNAVAKAMPALVGGSGDLAPSNVTWLHDEEAMDDSHPDGRNIHFGIREHAMGGIVNGLALHGGHLPYGATFLVFSDYMRAPIRLSALMKAHVIWILTHDSFMVGEDGPTHQPIEHVDSLRLIPKLKVIRPADGNETVAAYRFALTYNGPTVLALTRQSLPQLAESSRVPENLTGYVLKQAGSDPDIQLFASGSEVHMALEAAQILEKEEGYSVEVISVPLLDLSDPGNLPALISRREKAIRIAVEAGTTRLFASFGIPHRIGLSRFGESGPGKDVAAHLGFTPRGIAERCKDIVLRERE